MNTLLWILAATILNGLVAFVGALTFWMNDKLLKKSIFYLVAFSAGTLLAGALLHLLPESLEYVSINTAAAFILVGFAVFYLIERLLHWHHCHDGHCTHHPMSYLVLIGDGIHNIIDGLVIAASFVISVPFGIVTTLLIIAHEIPQELGNFGILIHGGFSRNKALLYNFLAQLTCVIGGILGFYLSGANQFEAVLLPIAAGGFIYIAASDLIPELHKETDVKKSFAYFGMFLLGVAVIVLLKLFIGH